MFVVAGEDEHGWGLSHKGVVWHDGQWSPYTDPFPQNESTTIGVVFDGVAGTLGFIKDDRWLGVAFTGLDKVSTQGNARPAHLQRGAGGLPGPGLTATTLFQVSVPLYPMVASTARNTKMTLLSARRDIGTLMERCRTSVLRHLRHPKHNVARLPLPRSVRHYLSNGVVTPVTLPATNPAHRLLI